MVLIRTYLTQGERERWLSLKGGPSRPPLFGSPFPPSA